MKSNRLFLFSAAVALLLTVTSCGTKKVLTGGGSPAAGNDVSASQAERQRIDFLRMVYDNEAYTECISSKIKFAISTGSKDLSVSGSLKMKKDDVIRIQLTPFGLMEVGRLEFTKDYVLIMDRMNKEYIKAGYKDVDFLSRNGLDFYALQALFWNQLFIPGTQKITDSSLTSFLVTMQSNKPNSLISLTHGDMKYTWEADNNTGQIKDVAVNYSNAADGTTDVGCTYGSFRPLGAKQFPSDMTLRLRSDALKGGKTFSLNIQMSGFDTTSGWETRTAVSSKYKKVSVSDVMNRLLGM